MARAANCSKESLYKWFGDHDGLLAAMITFQSSKVKAEPRISGATGRAALVSQLTGITATLLTDGAGPLDAQAFKRRLEETAVSLRFAAALDTVGGGMRLLSAKRDEAFDLLRLAVTMPRFDADRFEQRRSQTIAALNQAEQRPPAVAQRTLTATVFAGHPYAITASGVREALRDLAVDQVKARARALLTREGLVLAAVGDIDAAELARQLDRTFGGLPAGATLPSLPDWNPPTTARTVSRRAAGAAELGAGRAARPPARGSRLVRGAGDGACAGRRAAVAPVQRGAREARARLQHLGRPARAAEGGAAGGLDRQRQRARGPVARRSSGPSWRGCARRRHRPGAGRRQDLSQRVAGAVARFLQRDCQSRAPDAGRPPAARLSRPARGD